MRIMLGMSIKENTDVEMPKVPMVGQAPARPGPSEAQGTGAAPTKETTQP